MWPETILIAKNGAMGQRRKVVSGEQPMPCDRFCFSPKVTVSVRGLVAT